MFDFTPFGKELIRDTSYISQMNYQQETSKFLIAQQMEIIAVIRERLLSLHNVDTSSLDDMEMTARIAIVVEIMNSKKLDSSQMPHVLAELSNKFMDMGALVGETMMAAEGTRH